MQPGVDVQLGSLRVDSGYYFTCYPAPHYLPLSALFAGLSQPAGVLHTGHICALFARALLERAEGLQDAAGDAQLVRVPDTLKPVI
jgi:hypothetical protein